MRSFNAGSINRAIVVLSPPGRIRASTASRSVARRTGTPSTSHARSAARCSRKSPCRARTPTRGSRRGLSTGPAAAASPASGGEQLLLGDGADLQPSHRGAQPLGGLGEEAWPLVVSGGGHDGSGPGGRVLGLEDTRADENAVAAKLHHERGIGRS